MEQNVKINYTAPTKQIDTISCAEYSFIKGLSEDSAHNIMRKIINILKEEQLTVRQSQTVLNTCKDYLLDHVFN